MIRVLLAAATSLVAIPVSAQTLPEGGFGVSPAFSGQMRQPPGVHPRFNPNGTLRRGDGHHRRHRHHDRFDGAVFAGPWGYYDTDINASWEADSFNDWWHDRPDRAYPRWVRDGRHDEGCDPERMWWSGSGWHC